MVRAEPKITPEGRVLVVTASCDSLQQRVVELEVERDDLAYKLDEASRQYEHQRTSSPRIIHLFYSLIIGVILGAAAYRWARKQIN